MVIKIQENLNNPENLYKEILLKLTKGISKGKIYNDPNLGLTCDIDPDIKVVDEVIRRLDSLGFELADQSYDDESDDDSYFVYTNVIDDMRVVCAIITNQKYNFSYVTVGYNEVEDKELFI